MSDVPMPGCERVVARDHPPARPRHGRRRVRSLQGRLKACQLPPLRTRGPRPAEGRTPRRGRSYRTITSRRSAADQAARGVPVGSPAPSGADHEDALETVGQTAWAGHRGRAGTTPVAPRATSPRLAPRQACAPRNEQRADEEPFRGARGQPAHRSATSEGSSGRVGLRNEPLRGQRRPRSDPRAAASHAPSGDHDTVPLRQVKPERALPGSRRVQTTEDRAVGNHARHRARRSLAGAHRGPASAIVVAIGPRRCGSVRPNGMDPERAWG